MWHKRYAGPVGRICSRLAASHSFIKGFNLHACPAGAYFCSCKSRQNTVKGDGFPLDEPLSVACSAGYERCKHRPYCAQIHSQGACGAFYVSSCRNRIKNQPYKRRRVGRNLRLSRADPALCSGQPSPLRCILLSPQGLTTLRGPRLYGVYRRVGVSGSSPSDFCLLFFIEK